MRIVVLTLLIIGGFEAYRYRVLIETRIWHLRHGDEIVLVNYRVPVPKNWYVIDTGDEGRLLVRLDTEDHTGNPMRDQKGQFHAFLSVDFPRTLSTANKLDLWTSLQTSTIKEEGSEPAQRSFNLDGETLSCVGGSKFSQIAPKTPQFFESDANTWQCMSSGQLEIRFAGTDADMPQLWEIVSHIRTRS
jgi:hypothetical protein